MRISDWSSDVCSSDLRSRRAVSPIDKARRFEDRRGDPLGKPPAIGCKGIGVVKIQQKCVLRHKRQGQVLSLERNPTQIIQCGARARFSHLDEMEIRDDVPRKLIAVQSPLDLHYPLTTLQPLHLHLTTPLHRT